MEEHIISYKPRRRQIHKLIDSAENWLYPDGLEWGVIKRQDPKAMIFHEGWDYTTFGKLYEVVARHKTRTISKS